MSEYKRAYIAGGTYFFTIVTYRRRKIFHIENNRALLGNVIRVCQNEKPFDINAIVLLPDHLHCLWTLPPGDKDYSIRWNMIKKNFTKKFILDGGTDWNVSAGKIAQGRRGVWQPRYWEHCIRDEADFENHFDHIHYNPVKHGYCCCPHEWPASSFHRWVIKGVYEKNWACGSTLPQTLKTINRDVGEPQ